MHIHHGEEEAFYVLGGEVTYHVGDQTFSAPPGTFAYLPRNVPHGSVCHTETGRVLCVDSPGGAENEFREMGASLSAGSRSSAGG